MRTRLVLAPLAALMALGVTSHAALTFDTSLAWSGPTTYDNGEPVTDPGTLSYRIYVAPLGISNAVFELVWEQTHAEPTTCAGGVPAGSDYCITLTDIPLPDGASGFQAYATALVTASPTLESGPSGLATSYFNTSSAPDPIFGDVPPGPIVINISGTVFKIDGLPAPP